MAKNRSKPKVLGLWAATAGLLSVAALAGNCCWPVCLTPHWC